MANEMSPQGVAETDTPTVHRNVVPWENQLIRTRFADMGIITVAAFVGLWLVRAAGSETDPGVVKVLFVVAVVAITGWAIWSVIRIERERSIHVACETCGKRFSTNLPWRCGYCDGLNRSKLSRFGILGRCQTCTEAVPAYECQFCGHENVLKAAWDGRHPARHADTPWAPPPGETYEQARARKHRAQEEAEDDTRLTVLQTQKLRAEYELMMQERHNEAFKQQGKPQPRIDPVTRLAQDLESAIGRLLNEVTTKKKLRDTINQQREWLETSPQFQTMSEEERLRTREKFDAIAERLERQLREDVA